MKKKRLSFFIDSEKSAKTVVFFSKWQFWCFILTATEMKLGIIQSILILLQLKTLHSLESRNEQGKVWCKKE